MTQSQVTLTTAPTVTLLAPVSGVLVPLDQVPDPVFAGKMLGDGIAIDPTEGLLKAPCAGQVRQLHRAKHAVTLTTDGGDSVLLHVGVDTVRLAGEGFRPLVSEGERVNAGQALLAFDLDSIAQRATSALVELVVTEGRTNLTFVQTSGVVAAGRQELIVLGGAADAPAAGRPAQGELVRTEALKILNPNGLHARPAARLSAKVKEFRASVQVHKGKLQARATSVTELMGLDLAHGDAIWLSAQGEDATAALQAARELIETGLGEDTHAPAAVVSAARRFDSTDPGVLGGVPASPGLAVGVVQLARAEVPPYEQHTKDRAADRARVAAALAMVTAELRAAEQAFRVAGEAEKAEIFAAHAELVADETIVADATRDVEAGASAPAAWVRAVEERTALLTALKNPLMRQRADDLKDVGHRVLLAILGVKETPKSFPPGTVLVCGELTPSEVAQLDGAHVSAIVSAAGGATSHAAIIARSMTIPYVAGVGTAIAKLQPGQRVIVDADQGFVRLHPQAHEIAAAESQITAYRQQRAERLESAVAPARTKDGRAIEVAANIGTVSEAERVVAQGADGVGLLRSEFLFMERRTAPTEQEQAQALQRIAKALGPNRSLVVRTLDVGGDKPLSYLPLPAEENPFLGVRGLRLSFRFPDLFDAQLRAILSAAPFAKLQVMFPMVAEVDELLRAKRRVLELAPPGTKVAVGVMVEVPSAALMADVLAEHVDFFSIGTNDLTQYTLAMDRGHPELAAQADALDPAVLRLIKMTADAGQRTGKWVGVCGGLAAEPLAAPLLVGLGVTELSVPGPSAADIKAVVRGLDFAECRALANRALGLPSSRAVRKLLESFKA